MKLLLLEFHPGLACQIPSVHVMRELIPRVAVQLVFEHFSVVLSSYIFVRAGRKGQAERPVSALAPTANTTRCDCFSSFWLASRATSCIAWNCLTGLWPQANAESRVLKCE